MASSCCHCLELLFWGLLVVDHLPVFTVGCVRFYGAADALLIYLPFFSWPPFISDIIDNIIPIIRGNESEVHCETRVVS